MQLRWDRVTLGYPGRPAVLTDITFELGVGLWGLAGKGKTTLLRSAAALLRPQQGQVLCDGENVWDDPVAYRWRVGYAPQDCEELPPLGAVRYLEYLGALKGIRAEHQRPRALALLEQFALPDRRLDTYSAGMKRRLVLATALLNDPDILLLDDPVIGLDPEQKVALMAHLASLAADRIILMATSLPEEADGLVRGWVAVQHEGVHLHADPDRRSLQALSRRGDGPR